MVFDIYWVSLVMAEFMGYAAVSITNGNIRLNIAFGFNRLKMYLMVPSQF